MLFLRPPPMPRKSGGRVRNAAATASNTVITAAAAASCIAPFAAVTAKSRFTARRAAVRGLRSVRFAAARDRLIGKTPGRNNPYCLRQTIRTPARRGRRFLIPSRGGSSRDSAGPKGPALLKLRGRPTVSRRVGGAARAPGYLGQRLLRGDDVRVVGRGTRR